MAVEGDPTGERPRLLASLSARIGESARPVLERLPTAELRYLEMRPDLQERYSNGKRGLWLLEWEMSAVERGERALDEIAACDRRDWKSARALDVGCGDGGFLVAMAKRGARAHGIDLSRGNVEGARLRALAWELPPTAVVARAESLPYPDGCFDVVTCGDVIEHVADPGLALAEIWRVLRPGGLLWLAAPTRWELRNILRDPHYGFFGISLLPRKAAAWYLAKVRRRLPTPDHYELERLPTYGATVAALRRLGFEILSGENRKLAALGRPDRIQSRWKRALVGFLLSAGFGKPLEAALRVAAELRTPIRLVCRKPKGERG